MSFSFPTCGGYISGGYSKAVVGDCGRTGKMWQMGTWVRNTVTNNAKVKCAVYRWNHWNGAGNFTLVAEFNEYTLPKTGVNGIRINMSIKDGTNHDLGVFSVNRSDGRNVSFVSGENEFFIDFSDVSGQFVFGWSFDGVVLRLWLVRLLPAGLS